MVYNSRSVRAYNTRSDCKVTEILIKHKNVLLQKYDLGHF